MGYIIGIDIGTTNTKAVAFTERGAVLASAGRSYAAITDHGGRHELEPSVLLEAFGEVVKEVMGKIREVAGGVISGEGEDEGLIEGAVADEGPVGISLSCAMHSLIAVDDSGVPLTRAITWADLRSKSYAADLKASEAGRGIYRRTGTPLHAMSPLSKLLWLKDAEPAVFARAAKFISIKEYIWWRLFGKYQVDHSIASATGLFDIYELEWYEESLSLAGIGADRLSVPVSCTHVERGLTGEGMRLLGMQPGAGEDRKSSLMLPFVIGGSDGCLANVGSGALRPGETALTIGTSGAIRMTAGAPQYDPGERIFNYVLTKEFYISGGATNNGGMVLQWYMDHFLGGSGLRDVGVLAAMAEAAPAGSDGLIFLPYLQGERAPVWDADAKAIFFGIRSVHGQAHFVRAMMEGVTYSLYQTGKVLEEHIGPIRHVLASGGFTRSPVWLQMMADVFNRDVYTTEGADASAMGAAILGFYALGMISGLEDTGAMEEANALVRKKDVYRPDAERHALYRRQFEIFTSLYDRLKDLMHT